MEKEEKWDLEIKAKSNLFDFNFVEIWRYRDLLLLFVKRDFVAQYKQTVLGPVWHIIQPTLTTIMFLFIFGRVAKIPTDGINPVLFYMAGITLWNYFSACLTATAATFLANASIFGKVYFPRIIMPLSVIASNMVRLGIQLSLLLASMLWFYFHGEPFTITYTIFALPILLILMAGIGLGLGIIVSSITTKYRDFSFLLSFAVQLGMYITPIAYPSSYLKTTKYAWVTLLNPLSPIIESFRHILFQKGTFHYQDLAYSATFMLGTLFIGLLMFNKVEKTFMDTV